MTDNNYKKYRGKCKEMCDELVANDPSLKLVRGHYYEPLWNRSEQHWWCVDVDGNIVDPTSKQFPSGGINEFYTEFDGYINCEYCGKRIHESNMRLQGRFPVCRDTDCALKLVGLA